MRARRRARRQGRASRRSRRERSRGGRLDARAGRGAHVCTIARHGTPDARWPARFPRKLASSLGVDLVVVGSAARTGLARVVLGSVAEQVVRHAGCPVLVARPKEHEAKLGLGIEPPCPDCVAVQTETQRAKLWCARHSEHHPHGQLHYELPAAFARGWMNFRPAR